MRIAPKPDMTPYSQITALWAQGVHVSSQGKTYQLALISPKYLQNIIDKFSGLGYDTSILQGYLNPDPNQLDNNPVGSNMPIATN